MSGVVQRTVGDDEAEMRLDRWFKTHYPDVKYGALQKLLRSGQVRVDGGRVKANTRLESGQSVRVPPLGNVASSDDAVPVVHEPRGLSKADEAFIQSLVIYKDDDMLAINKPSGIPVQGGTKSVRHIDGLLDGLRFDADERPRLVHRLDKDTSGVLLLARNRRMAQTLSRSLQSRDVSKEYWALVIGVPRPPEGVISSALAKEGAPGRQRMEVTDRSHDGARHATTEFQLVDQAAQRMSWLAMRPITGRTHQLRVHASALGHPIVGDGKYGDSSVHPDGEIAKKLHLHARSITVPRKGRLPLIITADLSSHMRDTWALLHFDARDGDGVFDDGNERPTRKNRS